MSRRKSFGNALIGVDQPHRKENYVGRVSTVGKGGKSISVTNMNNSQLRNLVPIMPYGIASSPPTGLMTYVLVNDNASRNGIIGVYDPNKPECSPGDSMMYSRGGASVHCRGNKVFINGIDILQKISGGSSSGGSSSSSSSVKIPIASDSTLGGIIVGEGLEIDETGRVKTCEHSHTWDQVTDKPSTFIPVEHSHAWSTITDKPSTFTPTEHSHAFADIDGLQNALNAKANSTSPKISTSIELHGATPYIDFHFANDQGDYTSRIIESTKGVLNVDASLQVKGTAVSLNGHTHGLNTSTITGTLPLSKGGTGATTVAGALKVLCNNGTANTAPAYVLGFDADYANGGYTTIANLRTKMITGGASTIAGSNLTASRALVSNSSGKVAVSAVTSTELGYLDGVTSNIQNQFSNLSTVVDNFKEEYTDFKSAHTHSKIVYDSTNYIPLVKDGDYYFFRPNVANNVILGSTGRPWYKIYTNRLEVIASKPAFPYIGSDGGGSTVSSATNMFVSAAGTVSRTTNTSSRTIKHDIKDLESNDIRAERLYYLNVYQAKYNEDVLSKDDCRYLKDLPMFIIEEMNEVYPMAVDKPSDNVKEWSWNPQYLIPPMVKLLQEQNKRIIALEQALLKIK